MPRTRTMRSFVVPLAGMIPVAALVYAVSLGPSPRKTLAELDPSLPAERVLRAFHRGSAGTPAVVTEHLLDPTWPHRTEAARYLGEAFYRPALTTLWRIAKDRSEALELRRAARTAARRIESGLGSWAILRPRSGRSDVAPSSFDRH